MSFLSPSASEASSYAYRCFRKTPVTVAHWRQLSSLLILLSLICAPISGMAQSREQEKRGIGVTSAPRQTPSSVTPSAPSDKPVLILQTGHTKSANAVAFSPDNQWLASGGKDNVIKIWDLATGNILRTLYGHTSNVNALAVSPDGKLLASGSGDINDKRDLGAFTQGGVVGGADDNTVRIWSVQTGQQLQVLRGHGLPVGALAFSNDGDSLTSVSGDAVKVWDVAAGTRAAFPGNKVRQKRNGKAQHPRLIGLFFRLWEQAKETRGATLKEFQNVGVENSS